MTSNRILWTNRNLQNPTAREKAALGFIDTVQAGIVDFDLSVIAKEFANLPEINLFNQKFPELSPQAKRLFEKLYLVNAQNPLVGLKIITILACNIECAFYTQKLKEVVFQRLKAWLLLEELPRRSRIEWGLFCWNNWPVKYSNYDNAEFIDPLLKLLIEESRVDPECTLEIYDSLHKGRSSDCYVFNQFKEDPEDFLMFARNIAQIRPHILREALMKYIRDGKRGFGGYVADLGRLKESCNELFKIYRKNEGLTNEEIESILVDLILYSDPELPWYNQLHESLWEIEERKTEKDKRSIRNHFVISVNAQKEFTFFPDIINSYRKWLNRYKSQEWLNIVNVINHSKEMLELVNFSLNAEHPITRNRSFLEPNNRQLIEETIKSFWEMVDYLDECSHELYLYALETALEKPTFTVKATEEVALESKRLFILAFEDFCINNIEKAALLVTYMISRSGYTEIKIHIGEVLDIVYPTLLSINANVAKESLKEGTKGEFGHMRLWRPRV